MRCCYIDTSRVFRGMHGFQWLQIFAILDGGLVYIPWLSPTNEHSKLEERFGPFRVRLHGLLKEKRGGNTSTLRETQNAFEGAFVVQDIIEKAMGLVHLILIRECAVKTAVRG